MAKPIFLVSLPSHVTPQSAADIDHVLGDRFDDYHVLTYIGANLDEVAFRVIYEKDFDEVRFQELKDIINSTIKK